MWRARRGTRPRKNQSRRGDSNPEPSAYKNSGTGRSGRLLLVRLTAPVAGLEVVPAADEFQGQPRGQTIHSGPPRQPGKQLSRRARSMHDGADTTRTRRSRATRDHRFSPSRSPPTTPRSSPPVARHERSRQRWSNDASRTLGEPP